MRTVLRKILADVRARKGRTFLVSLSILVGVFGASLMIGIGDIIGSQLRADLHPEELPMLTVSLSLPEGTTTLEDNRALVRTLVAETHAVAAMGQVFAEVDWRTPEDADRLAEGMLITYSEPLDQLPLEPITRLMSGSFPAPGEREIVVEQRFADEFGLGVGDLVVFPRRDRVGEPVQWKIAGVVYAPYVATQVDDPELLMFANYAQAQEIAEITDLDVISVRYETFDMAYRTMDTVIRLIGSESPYVVEDVFLDDPDNSLKMQEVNDVVGVTNMLGIISVVVSGFLVINVTNAIVVEQRRQIGIMKSLGATRLETFLVYAGMALTYGVIGTTLGILLAIPATASMASGLANLSETYIGGFRLSARGIGIGVAMGLLMPVLVTIIPVLNGTRVTILEALTDLGISSRWGQGPVARLLRWLPLPIGIRQALSNTVQKRGRLALTIITLTLAAGSFMGVTAAYSSVGNLVETAFAQFDYDLKIYPRGVHSLPEIEALLKAEGIAYDRLTSGVELAVGLEGYKNPESSVESSQIGVTGIDPANSPYRLDLREGDGWQAGVDCLAQLETPECRSVILSYTVADQIGKKVGDTVFISGGGASYPFLVVGIDNIPVDTVYFRWDVLAALAEYVNANGQPVPNVFFLKMAGDDPSAEEVDALIGRIESVLLARGTQAGFDNQPENEAEEQEGLDIFAMVFNMMSALLAIVGGIGLLAVLSMAVLERQKEIGVMRSLGAGSGAIISQFLTEGVLVGIIAWALGVPLSFWLAPVLIDSLPFSTTIDFSYPPEIILMGLVGVVLFAALASLWPSVAASRKTVSEILRYQ